MGHNPPPKVQEIQRKNLANFDSWVASNGKFIVPGKDKAIIYAGYPEGEFQKIKTLCSTDPEMRPMYEIIKVVQLQNPEQRHFAKYENLEFVLRGIRNPSIQIYEAINVGNAAQKFPDMFECAKKLADPKTEFLEKGRSGHVWDKLSEQYVKNSSGEVQIWMGSKKNHKLVDESTTFIRAELAALIQRNKLPPATAMNAARIIKAFCEHHQKQKIFNEQLMNRVLTILKTGHKH